MMPCVYDPSGDYEAPFDAARCAAAVSADGNRQCARKGSVLEVGYLWCKQHAPGAVRKREAKHDARLEQTRARNAVVKAEQAVVEAAIGWHRTWHNHKALHTAVKRLLDARAKLAREMAQ